MNASELKKIATAIVSRINDLGFTKDGKAMVIDQGFEVVAAMEGMRNQHALRASLQPELVVFPEQWEPCTPAYLDKGGCCSDLRVWNPVTRNHYHPKLGVHAHAKTPFADTMAANRTWETLLSEQGWSDSTVSGLMKSFLQDHNLWGRFVSHCADRVEPDSELSQVIAGLSESIGEKGYDMTKSIGGTWCWVRLDGESSADFPSEEEAWLDLIATVCTAADIDPEALKRNPVETQIRQILDAAKTTKMERFIQELQKRWGGEHPHYDKDDWKYDVNNGDTKLGYWEWVAHNIESNGGEDEHCNCGHPLSDNEGFDGMCGSCADRAEGQETRPDVEILVNGTEYSFYIGAMNSEQLDAELTLRDVDCFSEKSDEIRAALMGWYDAQSRKKADDAFEAFDFSSGLERPYIVEAFNGWEVSGHNTFSRVVFLEKAENHQGPTIKCVFRCEATPLSVDVSVTI